MTVRDYALNLLAECGCKQDCYQASTLEEVAADLKEYARQHDGYVFPFPISDIASELIGIGLEQPRPFPINGEKSEVFSSLGDYVGKWGIGDLYEDAEKAIRGLLLSNEPFDTGWLGIRKEIISFRIQSNGSSLMLSVHEEIDDYPDILGDYEFPEGTDFDDEERIREIDEIWYSGPYRSEFTVERETDTMMNYEEVMEMLSELRKETSEQLHWWYIEFGWAIGAINLEELPDD